MGIFPTSGTMSRISLGGRCQADTFECCVITTNHAWEDWGAKEWVGVSRFLAQPGARSIQFNSRVLSVLVVSLRPVCYMFSFGLVACWFVQALIEGITLPLGFES
jgi:hypothetical protein